MVQDTIPFFDSLSSLKRWQPFLDLLMRLRDAPDTVSDEEIITAWENFQSQIQTNCQSAAEALMAGMASICYHKPHLAEQMLPGMLEPLFMLAVEDADEIIAWAKQYIEKAEPYMGRPDDSAIHWIETDFCNDYKMIQVVLKQLHEECES